MRKKESCEGEKYNYSKWRKKNELKYRLSRKIKWGE